MQRVWEPGKDPREGNVFIFATWNDCRHPERRAEPGVGLRMPGEGAAGIHKLLGDGVQVTLQSCHWIWVAREMEGEEGRLDSVWTTSVFLN